MEYNHPRNPLISSLLTLTLVLVLVIANCSDGPQIPLNNNQSTQPGNEEMEIPASAANSGAGTGSNAGGANNNQKEDPKRPMTVEELMNRKVCTADSCLERAVKVKNGYAEVEAYDPNQPVDPKDINWMKYLRGSKFNPRSSRVKPDQAGTEYDQTANRLQTNDYTKNAGVERMDPGAGTTRDYIMFMFKMLNDLKSEVNRLVLTRTTMETQEFLTILNTMIDLINLSKDDPASKILTVEPDFFRAEMGKMTFDELRVGYIDPAVPSPKPEPIANNLPPGVQVIREINGGVPYYRLQCPSPEICQGIDTENINFDMLEQISAEEFDFGGRLLEVQSPYEQEVQVDAEGTSLVAAKEFGIISCRHLQSLFYLYGFSLKGKISGEISHVTLTEHGRAVIFIKDGLGPDGKDKWKYYPMYGESFFFFFTWFLYKFEPFNDSLKPWLAAELARHPMKVSTAVVDSAPRITIGNNAEKMLFVLDAINFTTKVGGQINFRLNYLRDSNEPQYTDIHNDYIQPFLEDPAYKDYTNLLRSFRFLSDRIQVTSYRAWTLNQDPAQMGIPRKFDLRMGGRRGYFTAPEIRGTARVSGVTAKVEIEYIEVQPGADRVHVRAKGTGKKFGIKKTKHESIYFKLNQPAKAE